jgi:hypothetical protein
MKGVWSILLLAIVSVPLQAQPRDPLIEFDDTAYAVPAIRWTPRSKGLIVRYERITAHSMYSDSQLEGLPDNRGQIYKDQRWEYRLRFPVYSSPKLSLAMGLQYFSETYRFRNLDVNQYPFHNDLNGRSLRTMGSNFYMVRNWRGNFYILFRAGVDFMGDYSYQRVPGTNYIRASASPLIGWKRNQDLSYAFGVAYGYRFGRALLLPVFQYQQNFNRQWAVDALLPGRIRFRYTANPKTLIYMGSEFNGANYVLNLDHPTFAQFDNLYLQKSELRSLLSLERELYDWLWLGVEAGLRTNISFTLTETPRSRREVVIFNRPDGALVVSVSLFGVVPRRFAKER